MPGPVIYEINTWLWLDELSRDTTTPITLSDVPAAEWDRLAAMTVDAVWLMGVWERSPVGTEVMRSHEDIRRLGAALVPGFTPDLIVGSPYCVRGYSPDERMGGFDGLDEARRQLWVRGLGLYLDFVPNHVAPDHPWVSQHPDYLIAGDEADLEGHPEMFTRVGDHIVAFGRDPFSAPWTDVIQVNNFHPGVRADTVRLLSTLAEHCDGVRCDMAMLALTDVFVATWGPRAGAVPGQEYWTEVIRGVRRDHPDFAFLAEAYWDREWDLMQHGFDYCYDKILYDRLIRGDGPAVRAHLGADVSYQQRLVRFIENHDEDRAAAVMGPEQARAAAVAIALLPGATLDYDGQFEGCRLRLPVALGRRPDEAEDLALEDFYRVLLRAARDVRGRLAVPILGAPNEKSEHPADTWQLCAVTGWPDNDSGRNIVAWCWSTAGATFAVAVNFSAEPAQGEVQLPLPASLPAETFAVPDLMSGERYAQDAVVLRDHGLYVGLGPWQFHVLLFPF